MYRYFVIVAKCALFYAAELSQRLMVYYNVLVHLILVHLVLVCFDSYDEGRLQNKVLQMVLTHVYLHIIGFWSFLLFTT